MQRISRYVARQVAAATLMVLGVLLGIDVISGVIDQAGDLNNRYTVLSALWYMLLTVPSRIYGFLPFAALIGCLAGLGTLATTSELIVIRTAGVSVVRILWMAIRPTLLLALVGVLCAEYIGPPLKQAAESYRAVALEKDDIGISSYGLWHREADRFIHFNAVQPNGELLGITIFEMDAQRHLQSALFAKRAIYQGDHWLFEDVRETRFSAGKVERVEDAKRLWETQLSPQLLNILVLEPRDLSISGLWRYVRFLREQGSNAGEYELAFWNKVLLPLAIVSLILVAASIVFGPLRQSTMGYRVFVGVLIGVVFRVSQDMLAPASLVFGFAPILASAVPIGLSLLAGAFMLRRHA
ncbi:MAG: LPS export ABC transporter permease LptG [Spongiibacteraceae bacterium]